MTASESNALRSETPNAMHLRPMKVRSARWYSLVRLTRAVAKYVTLLIFTALSILPFVWILGIALRPRKEFYANPLALPVPPYWQNLVDAWTIGRFQSYSLNSVIITLPTVVGVLICAALAGYALAKINFKGNNIVFYLFLVGLMVPFQAIMIPLYYLMRDLGFLRTYLGAIVPFTALGIPLGVFMMRAFFRSLPGELADAAEIDGCDEVRTFWHIMLPLAKPALVTLGIVEFVGAWNGFLTPLLYVQKEELRPLTLGLLYFQDRHSTDYTLTAAGISIIIVPMILVYLIFQREFVRGLTSGALKG